MSDEPKSEPAAGDGPAPDPTPAPAAQPPVELPLASELPPLPAIEPKSRDTRPFRPASGEDHITTVNLGPAVEAPLPGAAAATPASPATPSSPAPATSSAASPAPAARPAAPPDLATRLVGLAYLIPCGLLLAFFLRNAFGPVGTESAMARFVVRAVAVLLPGYPAALALWALATGRRPPASWNVLGLPFEGWWFSTLATLSWREVRSFLARPVAYIVLFVWMASNGWFFVVLLQYYGDPSQPRDYQVPPSIYVTSNWVTFMVLVLCCPALTMRLLADEQSRGTLESLLTAPVTCAQVVLSKYVGVVVFYVAMVLSTLAFMFILKQYATDWDWGPVLGGYLGLLLLGGFFLATGLFASSVTDNQVVAFLLAVLPNLFLFPILSLLQSFAPTPELKDILGTIDVYGMTQELSRGVLQWKTLVFYAAATFSALFLAVRGVESHTWR